MPGTDVTAAQEVSGAMMGLGTHDPSLMRDELLHEIFESTVDKTPSAIAIDAGTGAPPLSYNQVESRANALAASLRARGIGRAQHVAIWLPRSGDVYIALLAILKCGAAYVPLDPDYPPERIEYIVQDAQAKALITTHDLAQTLNKIDAPIVLLAEITSELTRADPRRLNRRDTAASPDDTAYIIYTSGSTGRPKGVPITHRAVCNLVRAEGQIFAVNPTDRVYQGFSIAFDASVEEVWLAFFAGATLIPATAESIRAGAALAGNLTQLGVTILSCVPTMLALVRQDVPAIRLLILGGEVCPPDLVKRWWSPSRRIVNTYGPTEATVIATYADCTPGQPVTIGRAVPNYRLYIVDDAMNPASDGQPGELCIAGIGLSRAYLNRPELSAQKFLPNPFSSDHPYQRIYRTGDLARFTPTGDIEFLGRIDSQVKL
ncbi:MAG TPA: amino acid adenylation domain-containing protein, partial [Phycisphaerae bacterium]